MPAELNLSLAEFQKIEDSIASILGLSRDSEGNFEYGKEDLANLKEVFVDQNAGSKKAGYPQWNRRIRRIGAMESKRCLQP